jgi:hypothetical protein
LPEFLARKLKKGLRWLQDVGLDPYITGAFIDREEGLSAWIGSDHRSALPI